MTAIIAGFTIAKKKVATEVIDHILYNRRQKSCYGLQEQKQSPATTSPFQPALDQ
jgi:hypothetical protein